MACLVSPISGIALWTPTQVPRTQSVLANDWKPKPVLHDTVGKKGINADILYFSLVSIRGRRAAFVSLEARRHQQRPDKVRMYEQYIDDC